MTKKFTLAYVTSQFPELHETFILREAKKLKEKNIDLTIFSLKKCKDTIRHSDFDELKQNTIYVPFDFSAVIRPQFWIHVAYFIKMLWKTPLDLIKSIAVIPYSFSIIRIMKEKQITHLHAHWATIPTTVAYMINRMSRISYSVTAHAWDIFCGDKLVPQKLEKSQFVVTCTNYNRNYILAKHTALANVFLNYHGLDFSKFKRTADYLEGDQPLILTIGRLVEQKGFSFLIQALAIMKKWNLPFKCFIVGNGPLKSALLRQIKKNDLTDCVFLIGSQPQNAIKELFNEASLYVQPSVVASNNDRDGIPNTLIEALAYELPVVATRVSGIPELIIDNHTGVLVDERDPLELAWGMEKLLNNSVLAKKLGQTGRSHAHELFDTHHNTNQLINIFQNELHQN